jgi:D-lactate dehydrogenase
MMLALNRRLILANEQVYQQNFTVGNLIGYDFNNKTVGIVGTGQNR